MKTIALIVICLFLSIGQAQAGLIQWDAFNAGDGLAVKDESTGLVWLDLTQTAGKHYDAVSSLYSGWELASYSVVEELLITAFSTINISGSLGEKNKFEQECSNTSVCFDNAENWQGLFGSISGVNRSYQQYSYGLYLDSEDVLRMGGVFKNGSGSANLYGTEFNVGYSLDYETKYANGDFNYFGFYLIKSEPVFSAQPKLLPINDASAPTTSFFFLSLSGLLIFLKRNVKAKRSNKK
ncbi:MAG: hypothetical protein CL579_08490 [Alteromonadaceae bacterium]|jgi:hypothetical protein|nr:hypothetical protein [Alteromonadaceae bacterium]MBB19833.1 hypothetical protein [Rickettsiales bacterium]